MKKVDELIKLDLLERLADPSNYRYLWLGFEIKNLEAMANALHEDGPDGVSVVVQENGVTHMMVDVIENLTMTLLESINVPNRLINQYFEAFESVSYSITEDKVPCPSINESTQMSLHDVLETVGIDEFTNMVNSEACDPGYVQDHLNSPDVPWEGLSKDTFPMDRFQALVSDTRKEFKVNYIID